MSKTSWQRPLLVTIDYPPNLGGVAEYLRQVVEVLGGVEVWVPKLSRWLRPRWWLIFLRLLWKCAWLTTRPQAIIVSHVLPIGWLALWMRRWFGVPYAVILHGYDVALVETGSWQKKRQGQAVLAAAGLVVANSGYTAAIARRLGVSEKKMVICHPCPAVRVDVGKREVGKVGKVAGATTRLLTACRLTRRKAVDVVLRAVADLRRRGVRVELVVAGDGPELVNLQRLAGELGVAGWVNFVGRKTAEELLLLYQEADIFVQVPRDLWPDVESFGMVYLEAAQFAVPAVASQTGGIPESVVDGETGLLVPPDDVPATAAAIEKLVNDVELRQRLGEQGRERVGKEFRWERQLQPLKNWLDGLKK